RRFGFRPALTRFRDLRLRPRVKIACDHQQPPVEPLVQTGPAELLLRPILGRRPGRRRRWRFGGGHTELLPRLPMQLIDPDALDRGRPVVIPVLTASPLGLPNFFPIRRPVAAPLEL